MSARNLPFACLLSAFLSTACGGATVQTQVDEAGDEQVRAVSGGRPAGPELDGTRWRWVEAACTEGPLDLLARGFAQELRVKADGNALILTYDQQFATEQCTQTVVQRAVPPTEALADWQITEELRLSVPPTPACEGRAEQPRPGAVRLRNGKLEVLVQRSNVWCNGYEVRMAYEPLQPGALADDQVIRRYVASFSRRDADGVASLFADTGSLVEPFTVVDGVTPTRHDGREAVRAWYRQAVANVPWIAMRLEAVEPGAEGGQYVARWQYMDPRLTEPLLGQNRFTIAAGEIFETQIELASPAPGSTPTPAPATPAAATRGAR